MEDFASAILDEAEQNRHSRRRWTAAYWTQPSEEGPMVKLVVAYGKPEDEGAFDEYYKNTHEPLVHKIPGLDRFEHGHVLGTPDGSEPPYWYLASLYFADMDALQAGLGSEDGAAAAGDVANFATGGAAVMIAKT